MGRRPVPPPLAGHLSPRPAFGDYRLHRLVPLLSHAQLPHGRECRESAEVGVAHQPKLCRASAEDLLGRFSRSCTTGWWARLASNQRPADYESAALTRLSYGPQLRKPTGDRDRSESSGAGRTGTPRGGQGRVGPMAAAQTRPEAPTGVGEPGEFPRDLTKINRIFTYLDARGPTFARRPGAAIINSIPCRKSHGRQHSPERQGRSPSSKGPVKPGQ